MKRYAIVTNARDAAQVAAYLPGNYRVIWTAEVALYEGSDRMVQGHVIEGRDEAGWTLHGYVIPRFASGLIGCREIDLSHPVMKLIPDRDNDRLDAAAEEAAHEFANEVGRHMNGGDAFLEVAIEAAVGVGIGPEDEDALDAFYTRVQEHIDKLYPSLANIEAS